MRIGGTQCMKYSNYKTLHSFLGCSHTIESKNNSNFIIDTRYYLTVIHLEQNTH